MAEAASDLFGYPRYWAECFGTAPFLPTSRQEMDALGWDSCDVIIVTGDAYVDHPSFGMAVIGRLLEAQGFRVGVIAQPDWRSKDAFGTLGQPNLYFGVAAGNMDSMVNRYTADRKRRNDDAYSPDGEAGKRPDRAVIVYSQRCREAFPSTPIVIGSIEASLRRLAHYDYWNDDIRRSILIDSQADLLLFGNAERAIVSLTHRMSHGEPIDSIRDLRGTAFILDQLPAAVTIEDESELPEDRAAPVRLLGASAGESGVDAVRPAQIDRTEPPIGLSVTTERVRTVAAAKRTEFGAGAPLFDQVIQLPAFEQVVAEPKLYALASRILHRETNPMNARALVQAHGNRWVWLNPPPLPLTTPEIDGVFELPFQRVPHPVYGNAKIPAYEMIRFSVNIMRGCFGGCSFCSITEHEGRLIQSRSEDSILREIEQIRDKTPGFTGVISDLGGPTANMWRLACKSKTIESNCRRLSCVYPGICKNLNTDQTPLIGLYRKARALPGIKKVLIASGLRYDLAVETPEYVEELVSHHVGGYLKIAPEHTESGPLSKMMKPGIGTYDRFKAMFDEATQKSGKEQYLIPYFIAGHPGTTDEDMLNLALWLKSHGFRADQVQNFYPTPMATATAMYYSASDPLHRVSRDADPVAIVRHASQRRLHKAFLRYHDPENWPMLRRALRRMGRLDLIGNTKQHLVPRTQFSGPPGRGRPFLTQHQGLPKVPNRPSGRRRK
ncbi:MAG: YgiQ family radical SAM protein [Pseudomonadales bacterium]